MGRAAFVEHLGHTPRDTAASTGDPSQSDVLIAHPVYAGAAWLAVVNPAARTETTVRQILATAHARAQSAYERHSD